jgi:release factor glutamine methyltransferase
LTYVKEAAQATQADKPMRILDLCTGSGCIALALARHLPAHSADIQAVDVSASALSLARLNAYELAEQLSNNVTFSSMDILSTDQFSGEPFDLIVSNPPYVTHAEYDALTPDVKDWEDPGALVAENDGMAFHLHIAKAIGTRGILSPRLAWPRLVMEIGGSHQVSSITSALHENGFSNVQVWKDLAGKDRAIAAG